MEDFTFQPDVIFNLELPFPYWFALEDSVRAVGDIIGAYRQRHMDG